MSQSPLDLLSILFDHWNQVAEDTVRGLGEDSAGQFGCLYNDALAVHKAIEDAYPDEQRRSSLAFAEFTGLLKELLWLHAQFVSGNYPGVLRQLRFNWERLFRAHYADAYAEENPTATDVPGPGLDDKHEWLTEREHKLRWDTVIAPTLARLFTGGVPTETAALFKPLWDRLNRCVHPSGELREKMMGESALHLRDAFDEASARETLPDAAVVFGLIWLAVLSQFPAAVPALLAVPHAFRCCPQLRAALEAAGT